MDGEGGVGCAHTRGRLEADGMAAKDTNGLRRWRAEIRIRVRTPRPPTVMTDRPTLLYSIG
jgi:hypothetical protein